MRIILDKWAWIEFYDGSSEGKKVYRLMQNEQLYTSSVTVAEISVNYHRDNLVTDHSLDEIKNFIESNSEIIRPDTKICMEAGEIKEEKRKNHPDFGLMDAIILATARENDMKLVTGDPHLAEEEIAEDLRQ